MNMSDLYSKDYPELESLAFDPRTDPETLELLSQLEDIRVRNTVAGNPSTSLQTLTRLATDNDWRVRVSVVSNSSTPYEVLEKLAQSNQFDIIKAILNREDITPKILKILANSLGISTYFDNLITHPRCNGEIIIYMTERLGKWIYLPHHKDHLETVLSHPKTPKWYKAKLRTIMENQNK
jgi:hypothetical protein